MSSSSLLTSTSLTSSSHSLKSIPRHISASTLKSENNLNGILTIHPDLIVKRGEMKQKPSILKKWRSHYYLFDGHILYRVRPCNEHGEPLTENNNTHNKDNGNNSAVKPRSSFFFSHSNHNSNNTTTASQTTSNTTTPTSTTSPTSTEHDNNNQSPLMIPRLKELSRRDSDTSSGGSSLSARSAEEHFLIREKYVIIPDDNNNNNNNNNHSSFRSSSSFTTKNQHQDDHHHEKVQPTVSKVVDAKLLVGKDNTIGFFFDSSHSAPLFLMTDNEQDHKEWLQVLQRAVQKSQKKKQELSNDGYAINSVHLAVESMVDMAIVSDAFGEIQCVNKALVQYFGYIRSELMYRPIDMLMTSDVARKHSSYMSKYRKTGDQRLIGVPRVVTVRLRDQSTAKCVLSLGEIPDSTNSDKDRFIAVMKPVVEKPNKNISETNDQEHRMTEHRHKILQPMDNMIVSLSTGLREEMEGTAKRLQNHIMSGFAAIDEQVQKLNGTMSHLEKRSERLIGIISHQNLATEYMQDVINAEYSAVSSSSNGNNGASENKQRIQNLLTAIESQNISLSEKQLRMKHIIDGTSTEFDDIISVEIALRWFMLFASTEQSTDNFKFFLYVNKHYRTETDLDKLCMKRDFIMETFLRTDSLHELNLSSRVRTVIEEQYKHMQLIDASTSESEDTGDESGGGIDPKIQREQAFFNSVMSSVKAVMFDTFARFRSHNMFLVMREELSRALANECHIFDLKM